MVRWLFSTPAGANAKNISSLCLYFALFTIIVGFLTLLLFFNVFKLSSEFVLSSFVPVMIYHNLETDKSRILSDNKGKAGIYMWTHLKSGKRYIGSAVDLSKRLSNYYSLANLSRYKSMYINRALLFYDYSSFSLTIYEIIDISNLSKEEARKLILELEQFYIDTILPEYNILKVAGSLLGYKHTEESLAKISFAKVGGNNPMFGRTGENHPKLQFTFILVLLYSR